MKKIITSDGSPTFWNEEIQEYHHSITGAKEEAVRKFVEPCNLYERDYLVLVDVCFGLGYNTAAALDILKGKKVKIIGLENDEKVLQLIPHVSPPFATYPFIQDCIRKGYHGKRMGWELHILLGDAREKIKQIANNSIDCIFLDPFSPKKQPELWTREFMRELYRVIKSKGILTTYSCARSVRENLKAVGFSVEDGPCVGRRGPSTVARKISFKKFYIL